MIAAPARGAAQVQMKSAEPVEAPIADESGESGAGLRCDPRFCFQAPAWNMHDDARRTPSQTDFLRLNQSCRQAPH